MSDTPYSYPRGYLGWGELPPFRRERPCPRCGGDTRVRSPRELCAECHASPERAATLKARERRYNRTAYLKRRSRNA